MVPSAARGDLDRCADMLPIGDARGPWAARLGARERRPSHGSDRDHRASPATPNRRAGLSHAAVHRLRRTLATDLLRHGAPLLEVGQIPRHRQRLPCHPPRARLVEVGVAAAELAGVVLWRCACSQWRGWRARAPGARGWRACLPVGGLIRTSLDAPPCAAGGNGGSSEGGCRGGGVRGRRGFHGEVEFVGQPVARRHLACLRQARGGSCPGG